MSAVMDALEHPAFQPYWVAFALAHGCRPEDLERGVLTNIAFIRWIDDQWAEFGFAPGDPRSEADREAFREWLASRVPEAVAR